MKFDLGSPHSSKSYLDVAVMLGILALLVFGRIPLSNAATSNQGPTSPSTCPPRLLTGETRVAETGINQSAAQDLAASTAASYSSEYNSESFDSVFYSTTWNMSCAISIVEVTVDYDLKGANGATYVLQVAEDPSLTSVLSTNVYQDIPRTGPNVASSVKWAGYQYYSSYGTAVNEVGADWYIPSISGASDNCSDYLNDWCLISMWVGLSPTGSYIAQTGTDAYCSTLCNSSHYYHYDYWYEFYNGSGAPNECSAASGGDQIGADTTYNGSTAPSYTTSIYDYSLSSGCSANSPSGFSTSSTYYSTYMSEVPPGSPGYGLPDFGSISVSGAYYYDSNYNNFVTIGAAGSSDNAYYLDYNGTYAGSASCLGNTYNVNVCPGSVSSGDFDINYENAGGY